jgi:ABC-type multidrug transport system permease subunit
MWNKIFLHIFAALFSGFTFWKIGNGTFSLQLRLFAIFNFIFVAPGCINQMQPFFLHSRDIFETREKKVSALVGPYWHTSIAKPSFHIVQNLPLERLYWSADSDGDSIPYYLRHAILCVLVLHSRTSGGGQYFRTCLSSDDL